MKNFYRLKTRCTSILIILFIAVQTTSCSTEMSPKAFTATDTNSVTRTKNATNNAAVISGNSTGSVTEDNDPDNDNLLETSGNLSITDSDAGEAAFIAKTINGDYGNLTINTSGTWIYTANNNQAVIQDLATGASLNDKLTVSSIDGTTQVLTITIIGMDEITSNIDLSWVAPATRENNSIIALSEIAGYKIYYGAAPGQYPNSISINDGTVVDYTFQNFVAGNYYFVITTIDSNGLESQYSATVSVII